MTWRIRSVRTRILLLALVPLLSLFGLYVFATSITARNAINLARANTLKNATGQPTGNFERAIQTERLLAVLYLAAPTPENQAKLNAVEQATNHQAAALRTTLMSGATMNSASAAAETGHRHAAGRHQEPARPAGAGRRAHHQQACRARRVQHARRRQRPGAEPDHPPGDQLRARQPGAGVRADRPGGRPAGAGRRHPLGDMIDRLLPRRGPAAVRPTRRCPQVPGRGDPAGPRSALPRLLRPGRHSAGQRRADGTGEQGDEHPSAAPARGVAARLAAGRRRGQRRVLEGGLQSANTITAQASNIAWSTNLQLIVTGGHRPAPGHRLHRRGHPHRPQPGAGAGRPAPVRPHPGERAAARGGRPPRPRPGGRRAPPRPRTSRPPPTRSARCGTPSPRYSRPPCGPPSGRRGCGRA